MPAVDCERFRRFDSGELAPPRRDEVSGFLFFEGKIGRVGVQEYVDGLGKMHRELRLPEEVFDLESMRSFEQVPVTDTHPPELVTIDNAQSYACGATSMVRREGDWLVSPLSVWRADAISSIEGGRVELSNGYTCELDPTQLPELVARWGPYDFIQRRIRGNHVALVDEARAGPEARLRLDSGDARMVASPQSNPAPSAGQKTEPTPMPQTIRIDGHSFNVDDASAPLIQREIDRVVDKARADAAALVASEKQRADGLEKTLGVVKTNAVKIISIAAARGRRLDAMKARMMSCDECGGEGKVDEGEACSYCGGSGKVRMHDEIKAMGGESTHQEPDGDEPSPDSEEHGDEEGEEEMLDADELETERETEQSGKHADAAKRRRADAAKKRRDEATKLAKKRADSMRRRIDRAARGRVALEVQARRHLDAAVKLDGVDELGIKRQVLAKLEPKIKLDGRDETFILNAYDIAIARADEAAATAPTAIDLARGAAIPAAPAVPAIRGDAAGVVKSRTDFAASRANAWKDPPAK